LIEKLAKKGKKVKLLDEDGLDSALLDNQEGGGKSGRFLRESIEEQDIEEDIEESKGGGFNSSIGGI